MSTHLLLALALALPVGAPALKPAPKAPARNPLVGEWAFQALVADGEAEPNPGCTLTFAADGYFVAQQDGRHEGSGRYTSDPSTDPPQVDMDQEATEGTLKGVWRLEGDTLTICLSEDSRRGRPSAFAAPAGSGYLLATFKRVPME